VKAAALALSFILALLVAPYVGSAQEIGKMPRVGYVRSGTFASDPYRESFLRGMREHGWIGGRNITFDFRNYGDDHSALPSVMSDLLRSKPDIIVAGGTPAVRAAQAATQSIPIVMVVNDPLGGGLIQSLARPGANTTGLAALSVELSAKRLELLKEIIPRVTRVAILQNPDNPTHPVILKETEPAARLLGLALRIFEARRLEDFDRAFVAAREWPSDAVVALDDSAFIANREPLVAHAIRHRLPLICGFREIAEAGALLSYAPNLAESWYRLAAYVDKILKGTKPGDLPVEQGSRFQLVINLKTAKAIGLTVPELFLVRADEVIE
jgi:putative ABC transport system substrate-binding protein